MAADAPPIPFVIVVRGDDGLTNRFSDAVLEALRASPHFAWTGLQPGTLQVVIPSNIRWRRLNGKVEVLYSVEFEMDAKKLGISTGSCFDDELRVCANLIVNDAEITTQKK